MIELEDSEKDKTVPSCQSNQDISKESLLIDRGHTIELLTKVRPSSPITSLMALTQPWLTSLNGSASEQDKLQDLVKSVLEVFRRMGRDK